MKPKLITESTVKRCLALNHQNASKEFPDDIVRIIAEISKMLAQELLERYIALFRHLKS